LIVANRRRRSSNGAVGGIPSLEIRCTEGDRMGDLADSIDFLELRDVRIPSSVAFDLRKTV